MPINPEILPEPPEDNLAEQPSPLSREEIQKLIDDNMKYAYYMADKWKTIKGATQEEIIAQAINGLVKAANWYDPSKGSFASYARRTMHNYLGHMNFKQNEKFAHEVASIDDPIGDSEDSGGATLKDKVATEEPEAGYDMSKSEATNIINAEIELVKEPYKSMLKRWMAGESYRDLQADFKLSFAQIANLVNREMSNIKQRLAAKGILNMRDIWPESLERDDNGKWIYECLVAQISAALAINSLQESATREKLVNS